MSLTFWKKFCIDSGIPLLASTSYATAFADNRLTEDMVPELNKGVLKELGITIIGDIIAILKHAAVCTRTKKEGLEDKVKKAKAAPVQAKPSKEIKPAPVKPREPKPVKQAPKPPTKPAPKAKVAMTLADHLMEAIPSPEMSPAESDYEEQGVQAPQKNKRKKLAKEPKDKLKRKEAAIEPEEKIITKSRKLSEKPAPVPKTKPIKKDVMTKKQLIAAQRAAKEELQLAKLRISKRAAVQEERVSKRAAVEERLSSKTEERINAEVEKRLNVEVEKRLSSKRGVSEEERARKRGVSEEERPRKRVGGKRAVVMVQEQEESEEEEEESEEEVHVESDGRGSESEESLVERRMIGAEQRRMTGSDQRMTGSEKRGMMSDRIGERRVIGQAQTVRCMSPDSTTDPPARTVARCEQTATVILNTKGKCSVRPVSPPQGDSEDEKRTRKVMPRVDGKSALIRTVQRMIDAPILFQTSSARNSPAPKEKNGNNIESLRSEKMNSFRSDDEIKDVLNTNKFRSETDKFATVDESKAKKALTDANGKRKAASSRLGASATSAKLSERLGASTRMGASEDRLGVSDRLGHVRPVRGPTVRAKKLNLGGVAARLEMFNQSDSAGRAGSHGVFASEDKPLTRGRMASDDLVKTRAMASDHKPVKKFTKPATSASESVFSRLGR